MDTVKPSIMLATLFHDPPWKPWVIVGAVVKNTLLEEIEKKASNGGPAELRGLVEMYNEIVRGAGDSVDSHERQAALIPLAIAYQLSTLGMEHLKNLFIDAAKIIIDYKLDEESRKGHKTVRMADAVSSALDRHALYEFLKMENIHRKVYTRELRYVNPFTLDEVSLPRSIDAGKIVDFIVGYSSLVASALEKLCSGNEGCGMLAVTVSYLLLEPSWYYYTDSTPGEAYIPVADTRIPTHTVFDHTDAALSTLLLLDDGCLAVVDLAGVQGWISESRRLRDLWASSWLASFLAWKAVERLVRVYGPGVLVSPSGRLNPFLASSMLGPWLEDLKDKDDWIWAAVGLDPDKRWPVDPVLPSRLLIALPGSTCNSLEDTVARAVEEAWRNILGQALDLASKLCSSPADKCPLADKEAIELARDVEPPLGIRVLKTPVSIGDSIQDKITWYQEALARLRGLEEERRISAPGRRTGRRYHTLAKKLYSKDLVRNCTICGRGLAVVTLRDLKKRDLKAGGAWEEGRIVAEIGSEDLCPYCLVKRLLRYMASQNRLDDQVGIKYGQANIRWRSVLDHASRINVLRTILDSDKVVPDRLNDSLDKLKQALKSPDTEESLIEIYFSAGKPLLQPRAPSLIRKVVDNASNGSGSGNDLASKILWTIIVENLDNTKPLEDAREKVSREVMEVIDAIIDFIKEAKGTVEGVPRRYAIIVADGDYMGKGLLQGKIPSGWVYKKAEARDPVGGCVSPLNPARPRDYMVKGRVITPPGEHHDKVNRAINRLVDYLETILGDGEGEGEDPVSGGGRTLPVTPSYHATVSRSLALVSALDRKAAEDNDADIVYLGGDDAMIIAPPMIIESSGEDTFHITLPAARVADSLRANWRGVGWRLGFLYLTARDNKLLHVAPAPGAYGRSTVIYFSDAKKPMWISISAVRSLEEAKDGSRTIYRGEVEKEAWRKDLLVLASDTRGAVPSPMAPWPGAYAGKWIDRLLSLLLFLSTLHTGMPRPLSSRTLHDLPKTSTYISKALELGSLDLANVILSSELARHINRRHLKQVIERLCSAKLPPRISDREIADRLLGIVKSTLLGRRTGEGCTADQWAAGMLLLRLNNDLTSGGINYSANGYTSLARSTGIPVELAAFGLAYVYDSSAGLPQPLASRISYPPPWTRG